MRKFLDYTISREQLLNMSDKEVCDYLMYTDRDRKELDIAEKIYWWCIEELNMRYPEGSDDY